MRGHDHGLLRVARQPGEILQRVITHLAEDVRIHRDRAGEREQDGVAVRRSLGDERRRNAALDATPIVDDDLLLEYLGKLRCHDARHGVGATSRRRGDYPADRAHRVSVPRASCIRARGQACKKSQERERATKRPAASHHVPPPGPFLDGYRAYYTWAHANPG